LRALDTRSPDGLTGPAKGAFHAQIRYPSPCPLCPFRGPFMETRSSRPPDAHLGRALALALVLTATSLPAALALGTSRRITQFTHDSWTTRTGAPSGANTSITQTPDGYLWLGTAAEGLVRFDGVRFQRIEALDAVFPERADDIRSVLAAKDGTLWVGTAHGLVRRVGGTFTLVEGTQSRYATTLVEAPDGRIVFSRSGNGLGLLDGDRVEILRSGEEGPCVATVGQDGTLWLGTVRNLLAFGPDGRPRGARLDGFVTALLADRHDRLWVATRRGLLRLAKGAVDAGPTSSDSLPDTDITVLLEDRDGGVWAGTTSSGLRRVGLGNPDSFGAAAGLTSNVVTALFEDREGSLWVGTAGGLDRFREGTFTPFGAAEGLPNDAVASGPSVTEEVWCGSATARPGSSRRKTDSPATSAALYSRPGMALCGWVMTTGSLGSGENRSQPTERGSSSRGTSLPSPKTRKAS
jgi:ligand-binding sensor domain-containing protein